MRYLALAALLLAACHPQPTTLTYEGADARTSTDKIALGRRLADILDCTGCHGANLQGHDMADKPQDGAMYSPNVTLLLGKYNDDELDRLIRHGKPKDGREFWFMPVESFQFLSDGDFAALTAYLRTLKPVGKPLPPFKFNAVEYKDVEQGLLGNAQAQIRKYRDAPRIKRAACLGTIHRADHLHRLPQQCSSGLAELHAEPRHRRQLCETGAHASTYERPRQGWEGRWSDVGRRPTPVFAPHAA